MTKAVEYRLTKKVSVWLLELNPLGKKYFQSGPVIPFGEAGGLNSPIIGQLIDVLPTYTQRLAQIIDQAKRETAWSSVGKNFYEQFVKDPVFSYLVHSLTRDTTIKVGKDFKSANTYVSQAMRDTFDENTLWRMLQENGMGVKEMATLAKAHPLEMARFAIHSIPSLLALLLQNPDLYVQFAYGLSKSARKNKN
ncbi:hypothetical protein HY310_00825 [Candidatus Microgenomates bacterium]|nr:hypothetical protein [Candidatus Microgenomates bacterium]